MTDMARITVRLPGDLYKQLRTVARQQERTMQTIVARALRAYFAQAGEKEKP